MPCERLSAPLESSDEYIVGKIIAEAMQKHPPQFFLEKRALSRKSGAIEKLCYIFLADKANPGNVDVRSRRPENPGPRGCLPKGASMGQATAEVLPCDRRCARAGGRYGGWVAAKAQNAFIGFFNFPGVFSRRRELCYPYPNRNVGIFFCRWYNKLHDHFPE
jgi:hypothetical protein